MNLINSDNFDFNRVNSVVIGPGLGRLNNMKDYLSIIINKIKEINIPIILDGDSLFFLSNDISLVDNYNKFILTPNFNEFKRIYENLFNKKISFGISIDEIKKYAEELSNKLNNITIVVKGYKDVITNGKYTEIYSCDKSPRRCGGQGDILAGMIGFFSQFIDRNYNDEIKEYGFISACYYGCNLISKSALKAYEEYDCSTVSDDIINCIHCVYKEL